MDFQEFEKAVNTRKKPEKLSPYLEAMYEDGIGDWEKAHEIAQHINDSTGDLIHAYLHRKEGDRWNANYWYERAGRKIPQTSLEEEWKAIIKELLNN